MHSEGRKKENEVQRLKAWFLAISSKSSFKNKMKETSETLRQLKPHDVFNRLSEIVWLKKGQQILVMQSWIMKQVLVIKAWK
jgi:hypothetical protein